LRSNKIVQAGTNVHSRRRRPSDARRFVKQLDAGFLSGQLIRVCSHPTAWRRQKRNALLSVVCGGGGCCVGQTTNCWTATDRRRGTARAAALLLTVLTIDSSDNKIPLIIERANTTSASGIFAMFNRSTECGRAIDRRDVALPVQRSMADVEQLKPGE
jgi:hypothetical protein